MTEKKNDNYEKPESVGENDNLEGVTGGEGKYPYVKEDAPNPIKICKIGQFVGEGFIPPPKPAR